MVRKPILLFDLDGTLIIPRDEKITGGTSLHSMSTNSKTLMKKVAVIHGIPISEVGHLNRMSHIWNKARSYAEQNDFDEVNISKMMSELNECFNQEEAFEHSISVLVPGTMEGLEYLHKRSHLLGIVTTASRAGFERVSNSDVFGKFGRYFRYSITRDECKYIKPDPEPINRILGILDYPDFIYIGDTDHDAEASRAAGGAFILLNTRNHDENMISELNPDGVIESLLDLPRMIPNL